MWTVCAEPADSPDAVLLLRDYFAERTVRYFHRETTEQEIDETLDEFPSTGLALFLLLRADGAPAGCIGLHSTGELTRMHVAPPFRRQGGARGAAHDRRVVGPQARPQAPLPRHAHRPRRSPRLLRVVWLHRDRAGHRHAGALPGPLV